MDEKQLGLHFGASGAVLFFPGPQERKGARTMAKLQERLDEFKKTFESGTPPFNAPHEAIEKRHRATAELKASGIEDRALKVGDHAPILASHYLIRTIRRYD